MLMESGGFLAFERLVGALPLPCNGLSAPYFTPRKGMERMNQTVRQPGFMHAPGSDCRICKLPIVESDLVDWFKQAAEDRPDSKPEPLENPEEGGNTWYHGTFAKFEGPPASVVSRGEDITHWNNALGTHFTSLHRTAQGFGNRIAHVNLHIKNPKIYENEHEMGEDFMDKSGANDRGYEAEYDHHFVPEKTHSSEKPVCKECGLSQKDCESENLEDFDSGIYNELLDDLPEYAHRFKKHLKDNGYDGIVYGNSRENPIGHKCAIAFDETPVTVKKWENSEWKGHSDDSEGGGEKKATALFQHFAGDSDSGVGDRFSDEMPEGREVPPNAVGYEPHEDEFWVSCGKGHTHYGEHGAAGMLIRHTDDEGNHRYLLQKRAPWVDHGKTWGVPGGAIRKGENPEEAAMNETKEEIGHLPGLKPIHRYTDDHDGWAYHTIVAQAPERFNISDADQNDESSGTGWFTREEMNELPLHPGFASSVDKVIGSVGKTATLNNLFQHFALTYDEDGSESDGDPWTTHNFDKPVKHTAARDFGPNKGPLPIQHGLYYRVHYTPRKWETEKATSTPGLMYKKQKEEYGDRTEPGYSSFDNPHDLHRYWDGKYWAGHKASTESQYQKHYKNAEDWFNKNHKVVIFKGEEVGRGHDQEPLVQPTHKADRQELSIEEFKKRLSQTPHPDTFDHWHEAEPLDPGGHYWSGNWWHGNGEKCDDAEKCHEDFPEPSSPEADPDTFAHYWDNHEDDDSVTHTAVLDSWRPNQRLFAPTIGSLDPRLFEDDKIRPEVRNFVMDRLAGLWDGKYDNWREWSRVYLAGSSISEWWADVNAIRDPEIGLTQGYHLNDDLDTLIGVEYGGLVEANPQFKGLSPKTVSAHMNDELRESCNKDNVYLYVPAEGIPGWERVAEPVGGKVRVGPWNATFYVNPNSYDIRRIKPYAAYDLTTDEWAVRPVQEPEGHRFSPSEWYYFEGVATEIKAALAMPEPYRSRRARHIWETIHSARSKAFVPTGYGVFDFRNAVEKYLDQAGLWQPLVEAKFPKQTKTALIDLFKKDGLQYDHEEAKERYARAGSRFFAGKSKRRDRGGPEDFGGDSSSSGGTKGSNDESGTDAQVPRTIIYETAAQRDLKKLQDSERKSATDKVDQIANNDPNLQTHTIKQLPGILTTKIDRRWRVVHSKGENNEVVVHGITLHDYDTIIRRLRTRKDK